jgi:two-component system, cell cycle sensor histidine kinase and response regulator CckA
MVFSRSMTPTRVPIDPEVAIHESLQAVRANLPAEITLLERVPNGLWSVLGDRAQLVQVVLALCTNAREAMPTGGTLTVTAENLRTPTQASTPNLWAKKGTFVVITIADTGGGIAPEAVGRIFDPFYTTKEIGKGTGLGLSVVHGIVTGHGGNVSVESELGQGSVFKVYVPANVTSGAA